MRKRILCFGDSLTWGYDPETGKRFDEGIRWTSVLQEKLGSDYVIIEEGQNGRTIANDDPSEGEKNGSLYIGPCLESQRPLDMIIIMLGTNNLKPKFGLCASDIAGQMDKMLQKIMSVNHFKLEDQMEIVLVCPPIIGENIRNSGLGDSFGYEKAIELSKKLAPLYRDLALKYNMTYIDASQYVVTSEADSIHMDSKNQQKLGEVIYETIREIV